VEEDGKDGEVSLSNERSAAILFIIGCGVEKDRRRLHLGWINSGELSVEDGHVVLATVPAEDAVSLLFESDVVGHAWDLFGVSDGLKWGARLIDLTYDHGDSDVGDRVERVSCRRDVVRVRPRIDERLELIIPSHLVPMITQLDGGSQIIGAEC